MRINFVVVLGGGLLVELMKRATQNKQFAELDHAIKTKVPNNYLLTEEQNI